MSQKLIPIDGGIVPEVQTTSEGLRLNVLSPQYIKIKNLEERPTEWIFEGRPIYRRLPGVSETYQIDFFNVVSAPNTAVSAEIQDIGYVYIPWDGSSSGGGSLEVIESPTKKALLINSGEVIWKYGKTKVLPTIVDLEVLEVASGQYELSYQLVYDDSPVPKLYSVESFSLSGLPLTVTSSSDSVIGWRYPATNAFLNTQDNWWANRDTYFPYGVYSVQPTSSFIEWQSELSMAYSSLLLRCPKGTAYTGSATLSYVSNGINSFVQTVQIQSDSVGQFFKFLISAPVFQTGWNITFSSLDISIQSIEVSGTLTLLEPQASPSSRATLTMYPTGSSPKSITNQNEKVVDATYCPLAIVDISNDYAILNIRDTRFIVRRDFTPVADWLTKPFDEDLINLYEQVEDYSNLWMAPPNCMKQEYLSLEKSQVEVQN